MNNLYKKGSAMQKGLFVTILLFMFLWGGVVFGADTCPDVTGDWLATGQSVSHFGSNPQASFGPTATTISIDTQNGCFFSGVLHHLFDIMLIGNVSRVSSTQYAVMMQFRAAQFSGAHICEGTLNCSYTNGPGTNLSMYPICSTMMTTCHGYSFDPNNPDDNYISVSTMNFSKQ